jgi:nucleotide-binding universal stress UspA family protein
MGNIKTKSRVNRSTNQRLPWRRILVPIDFSPHSLRALDVAVSLARDCGAKLLLLSVVEPPVLAVGFEGALAMTPEATLAKDASQRLRKLAQGCLSGSLPVTCMVKRGRPFDVITRLAEQKRIDLIVLATHGRTGLERLMLGSTAERVVRHALCPVLVVRDRS